MMAQYCMSTSDRKLDKVVIFHNDNSDWVKKDTEELKQLFEAYDISFYDADVTKSEMINRIQQLSEEIEKGSTCVILIFLTQGELFSVHCKDYSVNLNELIAPLNGENCLNLAGKPKIIIAQLEPPEIQCDGPCAISSEADFIYVCSGSKFVKHHTGGSLFIHYLVENMRSCTNEQFEELLEKTRRDMTKYCKGLGINPEINPDDTLPTTKKRLLKILVIPKK